MSKCINMHVVWQQSLYNLGARKFVLPGLGRMGCIPSILSQNQFDRCSEEVNQLVLPFNANVKTMINNLNANLPGSRFIYIDVAHLFEDLLTNYRSYGMQELFLLNKTYLITIRTQISDNACNLLLCRIQRDRSRVLWNWTKWRANNMSSISNTMCKPRSIRFLGRIPPNRSCKHFVWKESFLWRSECGLSHEHSAACYRLKCLISQN